MRGESPLDPGSARLFPSGEHGDRVGVAQGRKVSAKGVAEKLLRDDRRRWVEADVSVELRRIDHVVAESPEFRLGLVEGREIKQWQASHWASEIDLHSLSPIV